MRVSFLRFCLLAVSGTLFASASFAQDTGIYLYRNAKTPDSPPTILLCIKSKQKTEKDCEKWTLAGNHYNPARPQVPPAVLVVDKFSVDGVVLRLTDPNHPDVTLKTLRGKPSDDVIFDGSVVSRDGSTGEFDALWGSMLKDSAPRNTTSVSTSRPEYGANGPTPDPNLDSSGRPKYGADAVGNGNIDAAGHPKYGADGPQFDAKANEDVDYGGRLPAIIAQLQRQLSTQESNCSRDRVRTKAIPESCYERDTVRNQLDEAQVSLHNEIQVLLEAHDEFTVSCNAGDQSACAKLRRVDASLEIDRR